MRRPLSLRLALTALAALAFAGPARAQSAGTIELGGFGRYSWYDTIPGAPTFKNQFGPGVRLGIFLGPGFAIEGDVSRTKTTMGPTATPVTVIPIHGRFLINAPLGPTALLLGFGYTRYEFRDGLTGGQHGANGLLGLRIGRGIISFRGEGTIDYFHKDFPKTGIPKQLQWGAQAGLSLLFGGHRKPADSDHDGVSDKVDECLNTPDGDKVDGRGCSLPKDSDRDGVGDGADQCPNTAAGERVDNKGCPLAKDSDADGVVDTADQCPNTPAGERVDAKGCTVAAPAAPAARDSDGDGVVDAADQCLNTPVGEKVDPRGCPLPKDSDGDGVVDAADQCLNTPVGEKVDPRGCPLAKDSDGDGVVDTADRCPNTPAGQVVDVNGCVPSKDADGDGVLDAADRCPNTPAGEKVDLNGCPVPKDSDGDGVYDAADRCPNTAAGQVVDANGCAPTRGDADSDGVLDTADQCPNTPAGLKVDAKGCQLLFETGKTAVVLQGVNFQSGSSRLLYTSKAILDRVAQSLVANPEVKVEVAGYTDDRGTAAANTRLSQARAEAVAVYLIEHGVAAERIVAKGYGPESPVTSNATALGRARNRRVELHKLP